MSKGKGTPTPSRGQRFEALEKSVKNLETSVRIMQMMQQQMGNSVMPMQQDLQSAMTQMQTIQYTLLAMQDVLQLDKEKLDERYQTLRLADYNELSDKEDAENNYTVKDTVDSDEDIVILSSTTPDQDKDEGIFRTKMLVKELGPDLSQSLVGKKVGDTIDHTMNDVRHVLEVMGVRQIPEVKEDCQCGNDKCDGKDCECDKETTE